jgi:hypothetical protein
METICMEHPIGYARYPRCSPGARSQGSATGWRRFRCAETGREVEVLFEERGLPGMRSTTAVKSCPVFEPATAVACRRHRLSATFRRRWEFALPVRTNAGEV